MNYIQYIRFQSIEEINRLKSEIDKIEGNMDLICGSVSADAKSILGVLALGFGRTLKCTYSNEQFNPIINKYVHRRENEIVSKA